MSRLLALLLTALALPFAPARPADISLEQVGWWSELQTGRVPLPLTAVTGTNLMVGVDPTGPNAIAAIRYRVPGTLNGTPIDPTAASVTVTLALANPFIGTAAVLACPTAGPWLPVLAGAWNARPAFSCAHAVTGVLASAHNSMTFALGPAQQSSEGVFDFALVPSGQLPFVALIAAPTEKDFTVKAPPAVAEVGGGVPGSTGGVAGQPGALPGDTSGVVLPAPGSDLVVTGAAAMPSTAAASRTPRALRRLASTHRDDQRAQRAVAFALLVAMVAATWWFGGRPIRGPRLLGSLAAAAPAGDAPDAATGGIGRFARPRRRLPPRL